MQILKEMIPSMMTRVPSREGTTMAAATSARPSAEKR
jgi:hypothetical protein